MKEIIYKGEKCLVVYWIPEFNRDGKKQVDEPRVYLSHPFNFTVPASEIKSLPEVPNENT